MTPVPFFSVLAPVAPIEYLHAALALTRNHDVGMVVAQLDPTNVLVCGFRLESPASVSDLALRTVDDPKVGGTY
jgi:hypothetical protein